MRKPLAYLCALASFLHQTSGLTLTEILDIDLPFDGADAGINFLLEYDSDQGTTQYNDIFESTFVTRTYDATQCIYMTKMGYFTGAVECSIDTPRYNGNTIGASSIFAMSEMINYFHSMDRDYPWNTQPQDSGGGGYRDACAEATQWDIYKSSQQFANKGAATSQDIALWFLASTNGSSELETVFCRFSAWSTSTTDMCYAHWQFTSDGLFKAQFIAEDDATGSEIVGIDYEQYGTEKVRAQLYYKVGDAKCTSNPPNCSHSTMFDGFTVESDSVTQTGIFAKGVSTTGQIVFDVTLDRTNDDACDKMALEDARVTLTSPQTLNPALTVATVQKLSHTVWRVTLQNDQAFTTKTVLQIDFGFPVDYIQSSSYSQRVIEVTYAPACSDVQLNADQITYHNNFVSWYVFPRDPVTIEFKKDSSFYSISPADCVGEPLFRMDVDCDGINSASVLSTFSFEASGSFNVVLDLSDEDVSTASCTQLELSATFPTNPAVPQISLLSQNIAAVQSMCPSVQVASQPDELLLLELLYQEKDQDVEMSIAQTLGHVVSFPDYSGSIGTVCGGITASSILCVDEPSGSLASALAYDPASDKVILSSADIDDAVVQPGNYACEITLGYASYSLSTTIDFQVDIYPDLLSCFDSYASAIAFDSNLASYELVLGEQGSTLADMNAVYQPIYSFCGPISYNFINESWLTIFFLDELADLITQLSFSQATDTALVGSHDIYFEAHFPMIDPSGLYKFTLLDPVVVVFSKEATQEETPFILKAPPQALSPLEHVVDLSFSTTIIELSFTAVDSDAENAGIGIEVDLGTTNSYISSSVNLNDGDDGSTGSVYLSIDGNLAFQALSDQLEEDLASEGVFFRDQTLIIEVSDLSSGGLTKSFTVTIRFETKDDTSDAEEEDVTEETPGDETIDDSKTESVEPELTETEKAEIKTQALAQVFSFIPNWNKKASVTESETAEEPVEIQVSKVKIDEAGLVRVSFDPPMSFVPDWQPLWDEKELQELTAFERKSHEEALLTILSLTFLKNSEELDQEYFISNLTNFTESGVSIRMNFSQPLLVSQGEQADQVRIRMLKDFFLTPTVDQKKQASPNTRLLAEESEDIASLNEDFEYIYVTYNIPKQLRSESELQSLEQSAELGAAALENQLIGSFVVNLLLKGVMGQLWNVFNTLQLILALPLLQVNTPAPVLKFNDVVTKIVNFQPIPKEKVYDSIVPPIFDLETSTEMEQEATLPPADDSDQDPDPESEAEAESETDAETEAESQLDEYFKGSSLLMNVLLSVLTILGLLVIILLLCCCRKKVIPKCCSCFQKLYFAIETRIFFNSILRACLQTFFATCISVCYSIKHLAGAQSENDDSRTIQIVIASLLTVYIVLSPLLACMCVRRKQRMLPTKNCKARFDSLYSKVDYYKRPSTHLYSTQFLLRRALFACLICFMTQTVVLQVLSVNVLNMCTVCYFIGYRPMWDRLNNGVHIFNECSVVILTLSMLLFTDFVGDPEDRYEYGYYFLYTAAFTACANLVVFLYVLVSSIYKAIRNAFIKRKAKKLQQKVKAIAEQTLPPMNMKRREVSDSELASSQVSVSVADQSSISSDASLKSKKVRRPRFTVLSDIESSGSKNQSPMMSTKQKDSVPQTLETTEAAMPLQHENIPLNQSSLQPIVALDWVTFTDQLIGKYAQPSSKAAEDQDTFTGQQIAKKSKPSQFARQQQTASLDISDANDSQVSEEPNTPLHYQSQHFVTSQRVFEIDPATTYMQGQRPKKGQLDFCDWVDSVVQRPEQAAVATSEVMAYGRSQAVIDQSLDQALSPNSLYHAMKAKQNVGAKTQQVNSPALLNSPVGAKKKKPFHFDESPLEMEFRSLGFSASSDERKKSQNSSEVAQSQANQMRPRRKRDLLAEFSSVGLYSDAVSVSQSSSAKSSSAQSSSVESSSSAQSSLESARSSEFSGSSASSQEQSSSSASESSSSSAPSASSLSSSVSASAQKARLDGRAAGPASKAQK